MNSLTFLWRSSRPRFWIYTLGPFILGSFAGAQSASFFVTWQFWLGIFCWSLPLNLFLYGVNDLGDNDTDQYNPKKRGYEFATPAHQRAFLLKVCLLSLLAVVPYLFFAHSTLATALLLIHLVLCATYSLKPVRFKARPFVDAGSNILYALPGFFAFLIAGGQQISPTYLVAAWCWCAAMHAFSAIPDITADAKAGLTTTAVKLGEKGTLLLCALLYMLSATLSYPALPWLIPAFGLVYVTMIYLASGKQASRVFKVYKVFPIVNGSIGFLLTWGIIFSRWSQLRG